MIPAWLRIRIPSRKRPQNVERLLKVFPTAVFVVHESEREEYAAAAGADHVETHKVVGSINAIRYGIIKAVPEEDSLLMIDDDFRCRVQVLCAEKPYNLTRPEDIRQIVVNTAQASRDVEAGMFGFASSGRPMFYKPQEPMAVFGFIQQAIGIHDKSILPDLAMRNMEDADMCLQCALRNRYMYIDQRFHFDFGLVWSGGGGLQGVRTTEQERKDRAYLAEKWGPYIQLYRSKKEQAKSTAQNMPMVLKVQRRSHLAAVT